MQNPKEIQQNFSPASVAQQTEMTVKKKLEKKQQLKENLKTIESEEKKMLSKKGRAFTPYRRNYEKKEHLSVRVHVCPSA